jgi:hypothetical protein
MDLEHPQRVSVIDPIGSAIEQVRLILFRPFDLSKWLVIGFCAWLAYLGQGGGGSGFNYTFHDHGAPNLAHAREVLLANLPWIIIGVAIFIPLLIIIGLVLCWLSSRGRFMFVHGIAGNKAEVAIPWKKFARHANSLFLFRVVVGLIGMVVVGLPVAIGVISIITLHATGLGAVAVPGLLVAILAAVAIAVVVAVVAKFTNDFVVPIMLLRTTSCLAGWREFLVLLGCNKARMVLYILFQIVISLVIFFIIASICLVGCCCCCVSALLLVPYVGTVILLPIFVFKRAYSLFYLRQFGSQFDVFSEPGLAEASRGGQAP